MIGVAAGSASIAGAGQLMAQEQAPSDSAGVGQVLGRLLARAVGLGSDSTSYSTDLLVEPPRGQLGPRTEAVIDPATVPGIRLTGDRWVIEAGVVFDETEAGGHLEFDAPVVVVGPDVSIDGARFSAVDAGRGHVLSASRSEYGFVARHIEVIGGAGTSAIGGVGENTTLESFAIVGFDGDGVKPRSGSVVTDGLIQVHGEPLSAKHYDGVQVTGQSGVTVGRLQISMVGVGTAAVFVHESPAGGPENLVHDIVVTHAPDVTRTFRFDESVVAHDLQGMGPVDSARSPASLLLIRPGADIDWSTIHSTFDSPVPVS
jgi:hypothetical protein